MDTAVPLQTRKMCSGLVRGLVLAMTGHGHGRRRHGHPFGRGGMLPPFFFLGGPGGGGFPRGARARRGDVRAALLILLAEEPRNGYQLMQEIEQRSDGVWRPSPGSVYPALSQLEDEGLVQLDERDGRRTYTLTDAGRAYVAERPEELNATWEEMTDAVDNDVAALFREMKQLGMAAMQIVHSGNVSHMTETRTQLANARKAIYALLAEDDA